MSHFLSKTIFAIFVLAFFGGFANVDAKHMGFVKNEYLSKIEKALSFHIDYKESSSELCLIGAKYDTDKSSQRQDVTSSRHCHPYTLFYHSLFHDKREKDLVIAELGILQGASLRMWKDYFPNALLFGFEYDTNLMNAFEEEHKHLNITLGHLDVKDPLSIERAFDSTHMQFDLIIDDTTHEFEDQLRVIENTHCYLKPGGMLIIEDITKSFNEQDYIDRLKPILHLFQDYYFISMDHKNRCSIGSDNDKLFILIKSGGESIFKNKKKMTIITPSIRPENLKEVRDSINFDYVDEWIIVYDGKKILTNPYVFAQEQNPKIKEYVHTSEGISGNPQRNFALDQIQNEDTYLYFLDDDNLIHKDLYKLLSIIGDNKIVTFDQKDRSKGNNIKLGQIDTAMFLVDFKLCHTIRWVLHEYAGDFYFIEECYSKNRDQWIYVNNLLCTYNSLSPSDGIHKDRHINHRHRSR